MNKILLYCNTGKTSSILARKMSNSARKQGIKIIIQSHAVSELTKTCNGSSVILLSPKIGFELRKSVSFIESLSIPVGIISTIDYGLMDTEKIFNYALSLIKSDETTTVI